MTPRFPAFDFYPNDFLGSFKMSRLDATEIGVFWLLLLLSWQELGFEFDRTSLAKWCRVDPRTFARVWPKIAPCFEERDGRFFNPRLELERAKKMQWSEKSRVGANKRWHKGGNAVGMPSTPTPSPTPIETETKDKDVARPSTALVVRKDNSLTAVQEHLRDVGLEAIQKAQKADARKLGAEFVFAYWCKKLRHENAMLDSAREKVIVRALKDNGENVGELLYVCDGASRDEWASQEIGRHDCKVIFRDRTSIEKYAGKCEGYRSGVVHPTWAKTFTEAA